MELCFLALFKVCNELTEAMFCERHAHEFAAVARQRGLQTEAPSEMVAEDMIDAEELCRRRMHSKYFCGND